MGKKKSVPTQVIAQAQQRYDTTTTPSQTEQEMAPLSQNFTNNYNQAAERNTADYGKMMGQYDQFRQSLGGPSKFDFQRVSAQRPEELNKAYGYLNEAAPGYREFASTGGYSPTDIQELRARGTSPIRAAYGNTMMEMDRARSLGGNAGAPNYIAAASRAQRELPGQMADATTGVNAQLADAIRQGKLAGLSGITNIGSTMGGLSSAESGRMLQADLANQGADIQTQGMGEQSLQNLRQNQLASIGGQASLYGTSPGLASTFGNQALNAYNTRAQMEQSRNQTGLGLLGMQLQGQAQQPTPWWKSALKFGGDAALIGLAASSRTVKHDIKRVSSKNLSKFAIKLKELPLYTWKYNGDETTHFGPIAEEFKDKFGIGDGKTLHLADVMGVVLASQKEALANA